MSTTARVLFPSAVALVIEELDAQLADLDARWAGVEAYPAVPNPRPARFVVIRRVGGPRDSLVTDAASLTVEGWAEDHREAEDLTNAARAVIHAMPGRNGNAVTRTDELAGTALLPDPESRWPRHTATLTVTVRGTAA